MRIRTATLLTLTLTLVLGLAAPAAQAGTIVSTVGGASNVSVAGGELVTVDSVITFGPTAVSGFGSGLEISFDATSLVAAGALGPLGGATTAPVGWVDLTGGTFTCNASGFCDNIAAAANFGAPGFVAGMSFALPSVTIDTTGLGPGFYSFGAVLGAAGPDGILGAGGVDLSSEYSAASVMLLIPEPGTFALVGLGLGILGLVGRQDSSSGVQRRAGPQRSRRLTEESR